MPVTLSADQNLALFDILDVPFSDGSNPAGFQSLDGMGAVSSQTYYVTASHNQAVSQITTYVANMSDDTKTNLIGLLNRFIALGTRRTRIEAGKVGDLDSVTQDPEEERELIGKRVKIRVPFYRHHEVLERQMGLKGGGINLPATR